MPLLTVFSFLVIFSGVAHAVPPIAHNFWGFAKDENLSSEFLITSGQQVIYFRSFELYNLGDGTGLGKLTYRTHPKINKNKKDRILKIIRNRLYLGEPSGHGKDYIAYALDELTDEGGTIIHYLQIILSPDSFTKEKGLLKRLLSRR